MSPLRKVSCAGAAIASVILLVPIAARPAAARDLSDTLQMTVVDVTPSTPKPTTKPQQLTVTLEITNPTGTEYPGVQILGERGNPIGSQQALDQALATTSASSGGLPFPVHLAAPVDVAANGTTTATVTATTSTIDDGTGICLCSNAAVYPLQFSAHWANGGIDNLLGAATTFLPSFDGAPPKPKLVDVSWVWPLLDRPHRLTEGTVFTDDSLAQSVSTSGRLSDALEVIEQVGPTIPITLVIDPELLDELEVMASGTYTVTQSDGKTVAGTGAAAAQAWLARLHVVLTNDRLVQVKLTPYGDPDVESVIARGLNWVNTTPAVMSARVTAALAPRSLDSTLAWPVTGAIGRRTLASLEAGGVNTVLLNSTAVTPRPSPSAAQPGLARLHVGGTDIIAALTSPAIEKYVAQAISANGPTATALPQIIAELAVRAAAEPLVEHVVAITAPRYVDPNVVNAVRVIQDTSMSTFSAPIALQDAVLSGSLVPSTYAGLARVPAALTAASGTGFDAATAIVSNLPSFRALIDTTTDPAALSVLRGLWVGRQLAESSAWRSAPLEANGYATALTTQVDQITDGVKIVQTAGTYTLASSTSPLPITVENDLSYPVIVRIDIRTLHALSGFSAHDIGKQSVAANSKRTLKIPITTQRSGRIQIEATLLTPNANGPIVLGPTGPVTLTVRSTALGFIGVVITVVAGVVLVVALVWRFARRWRDRRRRIALPFSPLAVGDPEPQA